MKKISYLSILLFCLILYWCSSRPEESHLVKPASPTSPIVTSTPSPNPKPTATHTITYGDEGIPKPVGISDADWKRAQRVHAAMKSENKKIYFYGKFVDQNNFPVAEVQVEIKVTRNNSSLLSSLGGGSLSESTIHNLTSDANGIIMIENQQGHGLMIERFFKSGYNSGGRQLYRDDGNEYGYSYGNILASPNSSEFHRPAPLHPVILRMWKKDPAKILITGYIEDKIYYKSDEYSFEWYVDIKEKKIVSGWGNFVVKITGQVVKKGDVTNVKIETMTGDGGVCVAKDYHHNRAPDKGYEQSVMAKQKSSYTSGESLYFKSADGKAYGYFAFGVNANDSYDPRVINFYISNLKLNLDGTPNLEQAEK